MIFYIPNNNITNLYTYDSRRASLKQIRTPYIYEMHRFLYSGKNLTLTLKNKMKYAYQVLHTRKMILFFNNNLKINKAGINFLLSQKKTTTCLSYKNTFNHMVKRTMLARVITKNSIGITTTEAAHIALTTKGVLNIVNQTSIINELCNNSSTKSEPLKESTKQITNFVIDNSFGNPTIKLNLLTPIYVKQKFPLNNLKDMLDPKITVADTEIPVRGFVEVAQANRLIRGNPYIEKVMVTGDTVKTSSKSMSNPDFIVTYKNKDFGESVRYLDCKTGSIESNGGYFRGTVHQVYTTDTGELWYPHNTNLYPKYIENFYEEVSNRLNSHSFMQEVRAKMSHEEFKVFTMESTALKVKINSLQVTQMFTINDIQLLQQSLNTIQSLPTFPKAFTVIHIHLIKTPTIQELQDPFVIRMLEKINPSIFNNERMVKKFISYALKIYSKEVDPNIVKVLQPLKPKYEWLKTELDDIAFDFYTL